MSIYSPGRPNKYSPQTGEGTRPTEVPGEYRFVDSSGTPKYIGETSNLSERMTVQVRTGRFDDCTFNYQIADGRSSSGTRREHETQKIEEHEPELNQRAGGGGRLASR